VNGAGSSFLSSPHWRAAWLAPPRNLPNKPACISPVLMEEVMRPTTLDVQNPLADWIVEIKLAFFGKHLKPKPVNCFPPLAN
jgi:hypothetical protein